MAEERVEAREQTWRQRMPWTEVFQGFRLALDFNKLILAAAGILVMAFGWWLLAIVFNAPRPEWGATSKEYRPDEYPGKDDAERRMAAWKAFKEARYKWTIRHSAAGRSDSVEAVDAGDVAADPNEFALLDSLKGTTFPATREGLVEAAKLNKDGQPLYPELANALGKELKDPKKQDALVEKLARLRKPERLTAGLLRTWPWFENRGPNPFLVVTGSARAEWEEGKFWDWLFRDQIPVLLEPLVKLIRPVIFFLKPDIGFVNSLYFFLVILWTVGTWAVFGGAITRIAAVQIARQEKLTLGEALRFTRRRLFSYLTAPLFPLVFVGFVLLFMILFGLVHSIPWFGEVIVDGLFWWLPLIGGLLMSVALIGLVGWPLMSATISAEGTDSWEAVSRSYSYVFQAPWQYIWSGVVALAYGAVLIFFIGFMGSFAVYMSKWGVAQTPTVKIFESREPSFLFAYAPTSFGWRNVGLQGVIVDGQPVVDPTTGRINAEAYDKYMGRGYEGKDSTNFVKRLGAGMVALWLYAFFLLILGFGYSFFWSASTIIYFLMRKKVDEAEMDEVYLEEEEPEGLPPLTQPAPAPASPAAPRATLPVVEPPRKPAVTQLAPANEAAPIAEPPPVNPVTPVEPTPRAEPEKPADKPSTPDKPTT